MPVILRILAAAIAFEAPAVVTEAAEPEVTDPQALAAIEEFRMALADAAQQVENALDDAIEKARQRRGASAEERLAAVRDLESQQDLFRSQGVIPETSQLKGAVTRYIRAHEQATTRLDRVLKPVIAALVDAGEQQQAADLLNLRQELVIGPGHELVGVWQLREGRGAHGYRERFEIEKQYGHWSVRRTFIDDRGRIVGEGRGSDFTVTDQTLQYLDLWQKKPVETWDDNCTFTVKRSDEFDGLHVHWQAPRGISGVISLVRQQ